MSAESFTFPISKLQERSENLVLLKQEFDVLNQKMRTAEYMQLIYRPTADDFHKNRYTNVLPHVHSRIVLSPEANEDPLFSNYVNANDCQIESMSGLENCRFIASQAPVEESLADFWRMVWQRKCSIIIMLTNLRDGQHEKATKYWPDAGQVVELGPFVISGMFEEADSEGLTTRTCSIRSKSDDRELIVTQLQWGGWPDYGVPADRWHELDHLFERYRFLRERQTGDEHTIVHCSAGIGRTGTFMSIEVLREHILHAAAPLLQSTASSSSALATSESESASSATPESASATASSADAKATVAAVASSTAGGAWRDQVRISVFDVVDRLRHRRPFMVQTFAQYQFIYAYLNYVLSVMP